MSSLIRDSNGEIVQAGRIGNNQTVAYTSSAATSTAIKSSSEVTIVRLVSTTDCHIAVGSSPTATTSDTLLPANTVEYFGVREDDKVSAIRSTADGTLHVTEMK